MRTWDKVSVKWDFYGMGLSTSVCRDGRLDLSIVDPYVINYEAQALVHGLYGMEAISLPRERHDSQRAGEMIVDIHGTHGGPSLPPQSEAIVKLLKAALNEPAQERRRVCRNGVIIRPPSTVSWMDTKFVLSFVLDNGESFCDVAVEVGRAVFDGLGVKDLNGFSLARFSTRRDSFVMIDGSWITFDRWLRISHRLPIYGPEDRP